MMLMVTYLTPILVVYSYDAGVGVVMNTDSVPMMGRALPSRQLLILKILQPTIPIKMNIRPRLTMIFHTI